MDDSSGEDDAHGARLSVGSLCPLALLQAATALLTAQHRDGLPTLCR